MNDIFRDMLKVVTAEDLLTRPATQREYIISPWLRSGETTLIWAGSGVGKTMLTLSLAIAMAGGGQVWQWSCERPRKVLIIDGEMNIDDLQDRVQMLAKQAVIGVDMELLGANLHIIARQDQNPDHVFYDITDARAQKAIRERCQGEGYEVVIIDNLSTVADGLVDENEASAFRSVQSFLLQMKATGMTTILVHHARKDGAEPRGSTALLTVFEVVLGLKRNDIAAVGSASFTTVFNKFRGRKSEATMSRSWNLSEAGWSVEDDPEDVLQAIAKALKSKKFCTQQELADHFKVTKGAMSKRLSKAKALGFVSDDELKGLWRDARALRQADESGTEVDFSSEIEVVDADF